MCRLCDWGEIFPREDPAAAQAEAAATVERQRRSRDLWAELMAQIEPPEAPPGQGGRG
jgi:hypothetical protein